MKSLSGLVFWDEVPCWGSPPPRIYAWNMYNVATWGSQRETMHFFGSFSAFWHYKNKERLSRGLDVKWHVPSTRLAGSRKWFSTGICSINRASSAMAGSPETPQNGENVHGFQVRTPICHIVPVSRAYPPPSWDTPSEAFPPCLGHPLWGFGTPEPLAPITQSNSWNFRPIT